MKHRPGSNTGKWLRSGASDRRAIKRHGARHRAMGSRSLLYWRAMPRALASRHRRRVRHGRYGDRLADRSDPHDQQHREGSEQRRAHEVEGERHTL